MSLSAYKPKRETIKVDSEFSLSVRALGLTDIRDLISNHLVALDELFARVTQSQQNVFASPNVDDGLTGNMLIKTLITDAPDIAARIICLANDEADVDSAMAGAMSLPLPVQMETLITIGNLTFADYGGPKKFVETVVTMIQAMRTAMPGSTLPSPKPNRKTRRS